MDQHVFELNIDVVLVSTTVIFCLSCHAAIIHKASSFMNTVWFHYYKVHFLQNIHKKNSIVRYIGVFFEWLIVVRWHHIATWIWVNIGSENGLLPNGNKPLPETMLPKLLFYNTSLKIIHLKLLAHIPGAKAFDPNYDRCSSFAIESLDGILYNDWPCLWEWFIPH